jgi:hypothetical protein
VGPRAGLNTMEKIRHLMPLPGTEPRFLGRPTPSLVAVPTAVTKALWHIDSLLDNDREISSYTIAVAK